MRQSGTYKNLSTKKRACLVLQIFPRFNSASVNCIHSIARECFFRYMQIFSGLSSPKNNFLPDLKNLAQLLDGT
jgi:hypothetical protein